RGSLSLVPVAGTAELRGRLGVAFDEAAFLRTVRDARRLGWHWLRLYYAVGLPGETQETLAGEGRPTRRASGMAAEPGPAGQSGAMRLSVRLRPFVPRPGAKLGHEAMLPEAELRRRLTQLKSRLSRLRAQVHVEDVLIALQEAVLARLESGGAA